MLTDFQGRVAVITGAGSGFGRAFAQQARGLGMRLVLADIEAAALATTAQELAGADLITERVDVSIGSEVDQLAARAREAYGRVDLLFNNAGVAVGGRIWEASAQDWAWLLGVNLWGVIHGIRAFVPEMLAQGAPGHVVNTASVAGLLAPPLMGAYNVSKHGVVAASETLYHDLREVGAQIGCSVLCPAFVPTGIDASERNRPASLVAQGPETASQRQAREALRRAVKSGRLEAAEVAAMTFDAIRDNRFYVLTHPRILDSVRLRHADIEATRNPSDPYGTRPDVPRPT